TSRQRGLESRRLATCCGRGTQAAFHTKALQLSDCDRRLSGLSAEIEVPPDLLKNRGVDDARVCLRRLLLGIQHQRHRTAGWTECCRIERVQAFVDGVR